MTTASDKETRFDWPLCYEAEDYVLAQLDAFLQRNPSAAELAERMRTETGTLLLDWVDHLVLSPAEQDTLRKLGYREETTLPTAPGFFCWGHPEAMLPRVLIQADLPAGSAPRLVAIRCDSVADFLVAHGLTNEPHGPPLTRYRWATVSEVEGCRLEVVERRGYAGFVPDTTASSAEKLLEALELWRTRPRQFDDEAEGYRQTQALLDRLVALAGQDLACHAVFTAEREYWQRRNRAAQVQKARQDRLGLGWANHDHHTFRSSRRYFVDLMQALEKLGFERRERYYAGAQAGWGAQILEQPVEKLVAFCDVDLAPAETELDFSRQPLPPVAKLGTIGLWVGLHGESFLDAGLHHLECRFDYELLREQLAEAGVPTMKPFSDFAFLKQAFTEGERWPVRQTRVDRLLEQGFIDEKQHQTFLAEGAIGSHLENLQRKGGFKGFNQKSVSVIIQVTDPRRQTASTKAES
jgi:hypothetical protein